MKSSNRYLSFTLVFLVFLQSEVSALPNTTSIILRVIRKPVVSAINSNDGVTDAEPFVTALIKFLEHNEEQAAGLFVQGLIVNAIKDPVKADNILDSIGGVARGVSFALTVAGQGGAVTQISDFVAAMGRSPMLDRWAGAVEEGKEVTYRNGDLIIEENEKLVVKNKEQAKEEGYVQLRDDEVLPMLNIKHGITGAKVYLDGEQVDTSVHDEYMFEGLSAGKHIIKIATKYNEGSVQVFVNPARETPSGYDQIELDINWKTSTLQIDPGIKGLSVYLNDTFLGKTPIDKTVRAGEYNLSIEDPWIEDYSSRIDAVPDRKISLSPELKSKGALKITEDLPPSAVVKVDGQPVDWKFSAVYLLPGEYNISVTDEKMYRFQDRISIRANKRLDYDPKIEYRTGSIVFTEGPNNNIDIFLDGEPIDEIMKNENMVEEIVIGTHIVAFNSSYNAEPITFEIEIKENKSTPLQLPVGRLSINNLDEYTEVYLNSKKIEPSKFVSNKFEMNLLEGEYEVSFKGRYISEKNMKKNISAGETTEINPDLLRYGIVPIQLTNFNSLDGSYVIIINNKQKQQDEKTIYGYNYSQLGTLLEIRVNKPGEVIDIDRKAKSVLLRLPEGINKVTGTYTDDSPSFEKSINVQSNSELPTLTIPLDHTQQYKLAQLEESLQRHSRKTSWGWVMTGTSLLTTATTGLMYYLASEAYAAYQDAAVTSEAEGHWSDVELYSNLMWAGAGVSVSTIALGSYLLFSRDNKDAIQSKYNRLKEDS